MRLQQISITNFKGLRSANFTPTTFSCLVGENNAGKSSVLQAIVYALNRPSQLPISLHYDPASPVEFEMKFADVSAEHVRRLAPEHQAKITTIVIDSQLTLKVRYRPNEKVELGAVRFVPRDQRYRSEAIDAAMSGKRGPAIRQAIANHYPEFLGEFPEGLNLGAAKDYLNSRIGLLPREDLEMAEGPLPSGIPSSITALLPEPIYIPAVKSLTDDLKTNQSTSFGRLLGLLLDDMTPDLAEINGSLEALNRLLNREIVNGEAIDQRHNKVRDLEALVESLLSENFPQVRVELKIPPPELKAILNTAQIFIDDGSRDLVDNKGDGIKRSLTFALLQAYVHLLSEQRQGGDDAETPAARPLLFLFEEPELYLHPRSQRVLFNTLARISQTHQVVVTTHSPIFFAPGVTANFVRVAKQSATPKPIGVLYPVDFSLEVTHAESFRLARFENADAAFFSQRVVLFEGESDDAYCKHLSRLLNESWDFDSKNVALVRVSGKGNFAKFRAFFGAFGIDVKLVADLDALFDGYQHLGGSAEANRLRNDALVRVDRRIAQLGTTAEPLARQIKAKVNQESWRARYETAKAALRLVQANGVVDAPLLASLDQLFTWEQEIARVRVCRDDNEAAAALVPVLDALRREGICVLAKGAIEDYYPVNAPTSGQKPDRALAAASIVQDRLQATALSEPLGAMRTTELEEIFEEIFRGL